MGIKIDSRQVISRDVLDQLAITANAEVDNLLRSINNNETSPLKLSSTGVDRIVSIGSIFVTNPETAKKRTIPTISNTLPNFTSGTITVPATGAGTITVSPGTSFVIAMTASQFQKIGINVDAAGSVALVAGTAAASLAAATAPPGIKNTFGVGYFVVRTDGSNNVANILLSDIYQYVGGGGSGGGDANSFLETIKANLRDGTWQLATPNIFSSVGSTLIDGTSTATYSLVTQNVGFSAASQFMLSTQSLDANEFLTAERDIASVQLMTQWATGFIDPAATYQVSRDGGANFQTVTMARIGTTDTFVGTQVFTAEPSSASLITQASTTTTATLNTTTQQRLAQTAVLANSSVLKSIDLYITVAGTPLGNMYIQIVRNSGGFPSTSLSDLMSESQPISIASLTTGINTITIPDTVAQAGTYHVVVRTDAAYQAQFTSTVGASNIQIQVDGTADGSTSFNGTVWSDPGTTAFKFTLKGRVLNLRVKVISSTSNVQLMGTGILYDIQTSGIVGGLKHRQVFKFNSTANPSTFALTMFRPDPDLLGVYLIETGQVFRAPAFTLSGNTVVFPANSFNNGGVPADLTLVMDQTNGTSFDNSDMNALLLAGNFLGSVDPTIDRSMAGRGIFLRRIDGTLREIGLDNSDNIVVYSV